MLTTPVGQAYWAKCFEPEEDRFDEGKPRCWSISWAKDQGDKETLALMEKIEEEFVRIHGDGAKPSKNAWPFKEQNDKEGNPSGLMEFRFKKNETTKKGMVLQAPAASANAKPRRAAASIRRHWAKSRHCSAANRARPTS